MNHNLCRALCCAAFLLPFPAAAGGGRCPQRQPEPAREPAMVLDQVNTAVWNRGWTVTSNDLRQTFTPALPRLMAVEVDLVLGNPGPDAGRVILMIYDAGGREIASTSRDVTTAGVDRVRFVFPTGVPVTPGQSYAIRVSGRVTFGWKYAVGGYERGAATLNGRPLAADTRTTFLFRTLGSN